MPYAAGSRQAGSPPPQRCGLENLTTTCSGRSFERHQILWIRVLYGAASGGPVWPAPGGDVVTKGFTRQMRFADKAGAPSRTHGHGCQPGLPEPRGHTAAAPPPG